jgi:hypothetical protein
MKLYKLRSDILINLDAITLVIDRGYAGVKRKIRIYTTDGQHNYELTNEEWTRFHQKLEESK